MHPKEEGFQDLEGLMPERPPKRRCCCWSSTPRAICCGLAVFLIIAVIVCGILLFVKGVDTNFDVSVKTLQNEVVSFTTNELQIRLKLEISVYNPNTWNVDVRKHHHHILSPSSSGFLVQVSGGNVDYKYDDFKLGSKAVPSLRLKGKERTTVEVDADVRVDKSQPGAMETFSSILQHCSTSKDWSLDISGHVKASVKWLLGVDVRVPITPRQQQMTCPDVPALPAGTDLQQALTRLSQTLP